MRKFIISFIIVQEVRHRPQKACVHKISQIYASTKGDFIMGIRRVENMIGGKGHVSQRLLEGDELKGKCGLYAQVTIEKGCSLGYHEHHGETETYYILSGEGEYDDNGVKRPVKPATSPSHQMEKDTVLPYRRHRSCVHGTDHFD